MCGILAVVSPVFSAEQAARALESLRHRGPDGHGTWRNARGDVLLGHTRLSIIDPEGGRQPLVNEQGEGTINPFMVLNELEKGLRHHSLITNEEQRKRYQEIIGLVKREYEEIVKNEVQRAISADEDAISKLAANYIDNVKAYTLKEKVKNRYTGQDEDPDERLMRSIEEKIEIADNRKEDFRREIMNFIGALAVEGKKFQWNTNDRLRRALELKLFEDQKDSIKLKTLVSAVVDKDTQEKIDVIKTRLIKNFGYNEVSATDVLNYVASIFARGDAKD